MYPGVSGEFCFLAEIEQIWSDMLADVLEQNNIPFYKESTMGAGLALRVGSFHERFRFYVPRDQLPYAQSLVEELFPES